MPEAQVNKPTPFGLALYSNQVLPYRVVGQAELVLANVLTHAVLGPAVAAFKFMGLFVFLSLCDVELQKLSWVKSSTGSTVYGILFLVAMMLACLVRFVMTLLAAIALKWTIIGRRRDGVYNWDTDTYNQRWKRYTHLQQVLDVTDLLPCLSGSEWLALYYRFLGCRMGPNVCIWETSGGPGVVEPDLFTIGEGTCIDNASVVAHMNTLGAFTLQSTRIGKNCTLRPKSKIMQGGAWTASRIEAKVFFVILFVASPCFRKPYFPPNRDQERWMMVLSCWRNLDVLRKAWHPTMACSKISKFCD